MAHRTKYSERIQRLDSSIAERIQDIRSERPDIGNAELARRVGCARATVIRYKKQLASKAADARKVALEAECIDNELKIADAARAKLEIINQKIEALRNEPTTPQNVSSLTRLLGAAERFLSLYGRATGQLGATVEVTNNITTALLNLEKRASQPWDVTSLPEVAQKVLAEDEPQCH